MTQIELDETKRAKTPQEHDLDFADAGQIFDGVQLTQVDERYDYDELRNVTFGTLAGCIVMLVGTTRGAAHRSIFMKCANDHDVAKYANALGRSGR